MKEKFISMEILVGFLVVLLVYIYAIYPVIKTAFGSMNTTGVNDVTLFLIGLVPAAFLIAILVGIFSYALGRPQQNVYGGQAYD